MDSRNFFALADAMPNFLQGMFWLEQHCDPVRNVGNIFSKTVSQVVLRIFCQPYSSNSAQWWPCATKDLWRHLKGSLQLLQLHAHLNPQCENQWQEPAIPCFAPLRSGKAEHTETYWHMFTAKTTYMRTWSLFLSRLSEEKRIDREHPPR